MWLEGKIVPARMLYQVVSAARLCFVALTAFADRAGTHRKVWGGRTGLFGRSQASRAAGMDFFQWGVHRNIPEARDWAQTEKASDERHGRKIAGVRCKRFGARNGLCRVCESFLRSEMWRAER